MLLLPLVDAIERVEPVGQRDRALERDPAHQLRVHEVARFAAHLPDALIAFVPPARRGVGQAHEERLRLGREIGEGVGEAIDAVEQLAVDIELALRPCTVADAHGRTVPPPGQMQELAFGEIVLAADPEHDLQVVAAPDRACR